jgi:hypothetical protein
MSEGACGNTNELMTETDRIKESISFKLFIMVRFKYRYFILYKSSFKRFFLSKKEKKRKEKQNASQFGLPYKEIMLIY